MNTRPARGGEAVGARHDHSGATFSFSLSVSRSAGNLSGLGCSGSGSGCFGGLAGGGGSVSGGGGLGGGGVSHGSLLGDSGARHSGGGRLGKGSTAGARPGEGMGYSMRGSGGGTSRGFIHVRALHWRRGGAARRSGGA